MILDRTAPNRKPAFGSVQANPAHSLCPSAGWVFTEGGGNVVIDIVNVRGANIISNSGWAVTSEGSVPIWDGTSYIDAGAADFKPYEVQAHSWVMRLNPTLGSASPLFNRASIGTDGYLHYMTSAGGFQYYYFDGALRGPYSSTNHVLTAGVWTTVGFTWNQTSGTASWYFPNGTLDSTAATTTGTIVHNASRNLYLGFRAATGEHYTGKIAFAYLYPRVLSASEINDIATWPYAFLTPKAPRLWMLGSPTGTAPAAQIPYTTINPLLAWQADPSLRYQPLPRELLTASDTPPQPWPRALDVIRAAWYPVLGLPMLSSRAIVQSGAAPVLPQPPGTIGVPYLRVHPIVIA